MSDRPWFLKTRRTEVEQPIEPPLCLGSHSNGEYFHQETARDRQLRRLILEQADRNARRVGMDRRHFLTTAMGMATSLAVIDSMSGCNDPGGNGHTIDKMAGVDGGAACAALDTSGLFIFDIQTHH